MLQGAAADCNSAGETHAWFDSRVAHQHSARRKSNSAKLDAEVPLELEIRRIGARYGAERDPWRMERFTNALGLPVGMPVPNWRPRAVPPAEPMAGMWCRIEPLDPERHAHDLFEAFSEDYEGRNWTYLPYGPFGTTVSFRDWLEGSCTGTDPMFHAILDASGRAAGVASYLRMNPDAGVIEVGHINYSPRLQRSPAATEAMHLMARRVFELGYRRYEWKCDALNARSCRAAERIGFKFEGVFRQATIYKGRNRDTAWYSIIDAEWPSLKHAHESWLSPENFDSEGRQRRSLGSFVDGGRTSG